MAMTLRYDAALRSPAERSHSVADSNVREFDSTDDARNGSLPRFERILYWCEPTCWVLGRALTSVCKRRTVITPRGVDLAGFAGLKGLNVRSILKTSVLAFSAILMFLRQCVVHAQCSALAHTYPSRPPILFVKAWCIENELVIGTVLHLLPVIYAPGSNPGHVTSYVMETLRCYVETGGNSFHIHCVNVRDLRVS